MGLSLKRVDQAEYADLDWQAELQASQEEATEVVDESEAGLEAESVAPEAAVEVPEDGTLSEEDTPAAEAPEDYTPSEEDTPEAAAEAPEDDTPSEEDTPVAEEPVKEIDESESVENTVAETAVEAVTE
jgi:hypothetical protein